MKEQQPQSPAPGPDIQGLRRLGWTDIDRLPGDEVSGRIGRVGVVHGRHAEVYFPSVDGDLELASYELLTVLDLTPVAGDWVVEQDGRITAVLTRRTCLSRPDPNGRDAQVLAANIDTVVLAVPIDLGLNLKVLERLAVMAWESGAVPAVTLTKCDAIPDAEEVAEQARQAVPGVEVLVTSAYRGIGLEDLRRLLSQGTTAMLGASGVGKTSLLNAIEGRSEPVREVRRDGQGRHTTTTRRLYPLLAGGVLLDLPGIRSLELLAGDEGVEETFADITELAELCRFNDCAHSGDAGCAVEQAVADGTLAERRLKSWRSIKAEMDYQVRRTDPAALSAQRQKWKQVTKQARADRRFR